MAKKKNKLKPPFTEVACSCLRKLAALRNRAISKKKQAIELRDDREEQIKECTDGEARKLEKLKAECLDAIHEIKHWDTLLKRCVNEMVETIEKGDDLELIPTLNPNPTEKTLLEDSVVGEEDEESDDSDEDSGDKVQKEDGKLEPVGAS